MQEPTAGVLKEALSLTAWVRVGLAVLGFQCLVQTEGNRSLALWCDCVSTEQIFRKDTGESDL